MRGKRILSVLLMGTMVFTGVLTGCAKKSVPAITLVVAHNFGDKSFYDSAKTGADKLSEEFGAEVTTVECEGADYDSKLRGAAKNADIVLAVGWELESIGDVAAEYPETKFVWADNTLDDIPDNLLCMTYAQNEGAFLAGYLAASVSRTGKIGMVGGQEDEGIVDFLTGYSQGALAARADCSIEHSYVGDFQDTATAKALAGTLADEGCDVLFHAAGAAGLGVFEAANEKDFMAIGVDSDQKYLDEQHIIASVTKDIGGSMYDVIASYLKGGKWNGEESVQYDLKSGYVSLEYGPEGSVQQVSDSMKEEVGLIAEQIKSGEIVVETALSK